MPKRSVLDISKHSLRLRTGDLDALGAAYPALGASVALRNLVSRHVDELRKRGGVATSDISVNLQPESANANTNAA